MFVNLHCHTAKGSLLDSIIKPEDLAKFASINGQKAIAISDHGYLSAFVDHYKACIDKKVKPILGNEVYEVDDMWEMNDTKDYKQPRYHLLLLAKNQLGWQNLMKITSVACTDGFYKKPRIDINYINNNSLGKGIICLTACQAGRLSKYLEKGQESDALTFVRKLKDTFDYVCCEIQSHNTDSQAFCNRLIYNFSQKYDLPYVITTDAHMYDYSLSESHSIFVEISEDREVGESYKDCYLQTEKDVYRILGYQFDKEIIKKGIKETSHIANMIEEIDIGLHQENQMPKINVPSSFKSNEDYLRHLVYATFDEKFGHLNHEEQQIRRERLEQEIPILTEVGYVDYFIMLYMLAKEGRKRKIPIGYSRGSGANCLCLFMLNVTQIDSVRWNLDFSRFANLGRRSPADFDWDISKRRRKEFIEISEELFGKENVAPICTFNTLSTKVAIRDVGKVLNESDKSPYKNQIPYTTRDMVAKMIPTIKTLNDLGEEEEKELLLKDVLEKNKKLKEVYDQFPLWFKYVMDIEGLPKSMGRHAAGTLITPKNVIEYCPMCFDKEKNRMIQLEMHNAMDDLSLVKMDYLGLENLDIIDDTLKMVGLTWDDVDINHLDLKDKEVFNNVYKNGNTIGIFQMESAEARRMCIEANVDNIEDIIVVNAANRPGTKDSFPEYCKNKLQPDKAEYVHDALKEIFKNTQGVLLYQEQALQLFRYAGFPEDEIDNARRAIGKKLEKEMKTMKPKFQNGLNLNGWAENQIETIWQLLEKQSSYCFNRGHAVAYGLLSYLTAYLKTHYTLYFMTALLTSKSDKVEKISSIINDCKRLNIRVLPPNVNKSDVNFTAIEKNNEILFGLLAVKGLGDSIINKIIEQRPYKNIKDFIDKVEDKTAIITLIKAGAIPVKNKMETLNKYASYMFLHREYKEVSSLPTYNKLLIEWGIDKEDYKIDNRKYNKDKMLIDYNKKRKEKFDEKQKVKYQNYMNEFYNKYAQDEYMWEFDTLSMFLTKDPLEDSYKMISQTWDDVQDGEKGVLLCVIVDIKRKKDKNGNQFAYIDLYTPYGIVEGTIWSRQLKEFADIVKKGSCIAILGRKKEGHCFVESIKTYKQWQQDIKGSKVKSVEYRRK